MPSISTPSKIAGTQSYTEHVLFSGSTSEEREAKVAEVIEKTAAILVPPYDHPDILLGQGTAGLELQEQYRELEGDSQAHLNIAISPLGGGGLLSGLCTFFSDNPQTLVMGAEPSFQGGDDGRRGLLAGERITSVKTLTIADGLRTPVGVIPWKVFSSSTEAKQRLLQGIYAVTEEEIKATMRLVLERMKAFVEPSGVVALAALLYNQELRKWIVDAQGEETWDVGVVFSGGNTTIDAIVGMFSEDKPSKVIEREEAKVGLDGKRVAENVAG